MSVGGMCGKKDKELFKFQYFSILSVEWVGFQSLFFLLFVLYQ